MKMMILYQSEIEAMILFKPNVIQRIFGKKSYVDLFEKKIISIHQLSERFQYLYDNLEYDYVFGFEDVKCVAWQSKYSGKNYLIPYLDNRQLKNQYTQI